MPGQKGRFTAPLPDGNIRAQAGFILLEVMISLAIAGGLLVTLIYTLNHHLRAARRHEIITIAISLAKEKIYEMESQPVAGKGGFSAPFEGYYYEAEVRESRLPGMLEVAVSVRGNDEEVSLTGLARRAPD